jgi:hypothetical protein
VAKELLGSIDKSSLVCIVANAQNSPKIDWEKPQKEFSFEGHLYDVVSVEVHNGEQYYYCFDDQAEAQLVRKIDLFLADQWGQHGHNTTKLLLQAFADPFVIHSKIRFDFYDHCSPTRLLISSIVSPLSKGWLAKAKQPPQFCV